MLFSEVINVRMVPMRL